MPLTAEQLLLDTFRYRLGGTRPVLEVERFEADLYRSNHALMKAALLEAQSIAARLGPAKDVRAAVLALYDTRLAEIAQMFPVFFVFESAYRAFTAARLTAVYGDDLWWDPVRQALLAKSDPQSVPALGGRPAKRDVIDALSHLLKGLKDPGMRQLRGTYDLLEAGTLTHVGRLISSHWTDIEPVFSQSGPLPLTSANFSDQFNKVRNARNDAYHHRLIRDRVKVAAIVERLLDLLDVHLGDRLDRLAKVQVAGLPVHVPQVPRHG
ncbi:hypothetical protein [Caulobacter sp.]|uniref:hypothetical protein n=1 Tax=Caulobacter sp. TaxID=78 RepID=UPI0031DB9E79